jgi:hypothetical protein
VTEGLSKRSVRPEFTRRHILLGGAAWTITAALSPQVRAQAYPSQNITLVVPFTPGGSTDILARLLGQKLEAALKFPVIVDNRPGAGGSVGMGYVARSAADGHTLAMGHIGTLAVNPALYPKLPYDPLRACLTMQYYGRLWHRHAGHGGSERVRRRLQHSWLAVRGCGSGGGSGSCQCRR